ncbi:MAG: EamA family transporter [Phyllobacteriaceae bacterium]|nr:EamA family transporter [Phyllobacteriaceae bacterium]
MPLPHIALATLVALIYGVAFVAIRMAVDEWPPLMVTGWRFLLAAIPLVFFIRPPKVHWGYVASYGFVQGVVMFGTAITAIAWGMPGGLASLVAQAQVFFTIGFAAFLFGEKPKAQHYAGALIALLGMVITGWGKVQEAAPLLPFMMMVFAAAAWGVANVISKAARPPDMVSFVVWSCLAAPVPLFIGSMLVEGTAFAWPGFWPSWQAAGAIAFMAWGATAFAFSAWTWLLRTHPAAVVTPFALLIPVFGFAAMALAYDEKLSAMTALGAALVFAGLAVNVFGGRLFRRPGAVDKANP